MFTEGVYKTEYSTKVQEHYNTFARNKDSSKKIHFKRAKKIQVKLPFEPMALTTEGER